MLCILCSARCHFEHNLTDKCCKLQTKKLKIASQQCNNFVISFTDHFQAEQQDNHHWAMWLSQAVFRLGCIFLLGNQHTFFHHQSKQWTPCLNCLKSIGTFSHFAIKISDFLVLFPFGLSFCFRKMVQFMTKPPLSQFGAPSTTQRGDNACGPMCFASNWLALHPVLTSLPMAAQLVCVNSSIGNIWWCLRTWGTFQLLVCSLLCLLDKETCLFDETVQFVRNCKRCHSAASHGPWLWNLLEHSMLLAKLHFKLPTGAHLLLMEC